jgi:predicted house-cleaning noncanonical NTP pyrophosphatase (MazG superfamily)
MEQKLQIITLGSISKQEIVKSLDVNILSNTLVLEIMDPFPGYHGANLPTEPIPRSIFLCTQKTYTDEEVMRISERISLKCKTCFSANPASIGIYNENYPAIRLWGLESYDYIPELQESFRNEGIEFKKKKNIKDVALLNIKKAFHIEETDEGIYKDIQTPKMFYFTIPYISWNLFEEITKNVKNNVGNKNFDAAQGMFFMNKVIDVVRLFGKEVETDYLKMLQTKYKEEIDKFFAK